jgi:transglutaminase superfamily protein
MERNARTRTPTPDSPIERANEHSEFRTPVRSEASNGSRYWLANLVFVARTRHGAIILDLGRNRYLGIGQAETLALERVVEDWPAQSSGSHAPSRHVAEKELIDSLSSSGIIRHGPRTPRAIPQTSVQLDGELVAIGDEIDAAASVHLGHIVCFAHSLIASYLALRFQPIASVIQSVHAHRLAAIRSGNDFDWRRASEFVSIFRRIRPYAFVAGGHCLLHALTLVRFLAHYNQFPHLVLGVKVDPWGAHSWVQYGNFLLDTNPEKVCGFTAILAV